MFRHLPPKFPPAWSIQFHKAPYGHSIGVTTQMLQIRPQIFWSNFTIPPQRLIFYSRVYFLMIESFPTIKDVSSSAEPEYVDNCLHREMDQGGAGRILHVRSSESDSCLMQIYFWISMSAPVEDKCRRGGTIRELDVKVNTKRGQDSIAVSFGEAQNILNSEFLQTWNIRPY